MSSLIQLSRRWVLGVLIWVGLGMVGGVLGAEVPPAVGREVSFSKEVLPILDKRCAQCHGRGKGKGGFRVDNREVLLKGGDTGPGAVVGKGAESLMVRLVAGMDPESIMPKKGKRLTVEEVGVLRAWVDQGMAWEEGVSLGKKEAQNLKPRQPEMPLGGGVGHPVDRFIGAYFSEKKVGWPEVVDDRVFARRVWMDVVGMLPPPSDLERFLAEEGAGKRERLVARLLSDGRGYAEHWMTFWNDMLRNDYRGTGYIDGGRKQITSWLFSALATNMPYDRFVSELVNPKEESAGFAKGIIWRGVVNASQTPELQAAQNIAQVFLGTNLKCASCHDSFVNDWTLKDAYGLANLYAESPLEIHECDKPTGEKAVSRFIFPELGTIDGSLKREERLGRLAALLTTPENGRLASTLVNRIWGRLMGRAFVEPVDDMDQAGWNQDLLDWLSADFVKSGYDVRHLLGRILTSRTYQLKAVGATEQVGKGYVFRGPTVRRLSAEQFRDALGGVTGVMHSTARGEPVNFWESMPVDARKEMEARWMPSSPRWIWKEPGAAVGAEAGTVYFRATLELPSEPVSGFVIGACDNGYTLYVNGKKAVTGRNHQRPQLESVLGHLVKGRNVIAVSAENDRQDEKEERKEKDGEWRGGKLNPAGLLVGVTVECEGGRRVGLGTDGSWVWTTAQFEGWEKVGFEPEGWHGAFELGDVGMEPWRVAPRYVGLVSAIAEHGRVRAVLVEADPMSVALGRPNREQVVTARGTAATTLQTLELTNGKTLASLLGVGAERLVKEHGGGSVRELVELVYRRAFSRGPTGEELKLAVGVVGEPVKREGLEDFLWAVAMLPEFQLVF